MSVSVNRRPENLSPNSTSNNRSGGAEGTKVDCLARVITPENIEFEYTLAGPFQRLPAFVFDFAVRVGTFLAIVFLIGLASSLLPLGGAVAAVASLLLFFGLSWFYGIYFETRFNGRTLGKMLFRLRVISIDGRPINATQAALRNLLRLADMCILLPLQVIDADAPPAYIIPSMSVGLIAMMLSPRLQRIGDLAAGTMVVSEHHRSNPWNVPPDDLRAFGLAELIPPSYVIPSSLAKTVGLYMENRKRLNPSRRSEIAGHVSRYLLPEFGMLADTSPDLLLCALYVRTFMSDLQRSEGLQRLRATTRGDNLTPLSNALVNPPINPTARSLAGPPSNSTGAAQ